MNDKKLESKRKVVGEYSQKEEKVLGFWKKEKIFERSVEERPEDNPYVFYDGPPFATGLPHYGHILSSVIKDLIPRYQTMKGKRVRRRWGWDCHGLPIETLVERELKISGKKEIEERGIELFNKTARSMVSTYVSQWKKTIERIGRFVDFDNSYKTMDATYMESVWWALKQLWDKNLVYEGKKVLMYCPRCETPVSNAETSMDNNYKDVSEESLTVKFKVVNPEKQDLPKKTYILAWTTTPWTLPGNVALAVGEGIEYVLAEKEGENLILAEKCLKANKIGEGDATKKIKGAELVGLKYEPLFEIEKAKEDKAWQVYPADFVTTEDGTGIVHTAVMYGEDDYELGEKVGLPQVPLLDSAGIYNDNAPELIRGIFYKDAEEKIIENLEKRNLIYDRFSYTHSYPFCWRCYSPLIYNAISAWFVDVQSQKERIIELNEKLNWYPANLKHGRFLNILKDAPDWNISRNRYWATPLPIWKCEKCGEVVCIGSIGELRDKAQNFDKVYTDFKLQIKNNRPCKNSKIHNSDPIDLHRPSIDKIEMECTKCRGNMRRVPEVVDAWVESASMPFAEWHYPFENEKEFKARFPGQYIAEYIAQTRAWFYYMHTLSVLLFDKISFENVVCTGTILAEDGSKMSKSKGNFPDPSDVLDRYGADVLRYYLMSSVVMKADNLFFSERDLRDAYNKLINISYNVLNFYKLNANDREPSKLEPDQASDVLDRWIILRTNGLIKVAEKSLDSYDTVKYSREIKKFAEDLSTWWVRRSRERFQQSDAPLAVLKWVLKIFSQVIAPVVPFLAEEIWKEIKGSNDPISVHLSFWPKAIEMLNGTEIEDMKKAKQVAEAGHSLRSEAGIRVRQPLAKIYWDARFENNPDQYEKLILDELNVENRADEASEIEQPSEHKGKDFEVIIEKKLGQRLKELGDLRELIRAIQQGRKSLGMDPKEKISAQYLTDSEDLSEFIKQNLELIEESANLNNFKRTKDADGGKALEVNLSGTVVKIILPTNAKNPH